MAIELTNDNFDSEISEGIVVVDFWAPWCGPCKQLSPSIDKLATEYQDRAKITKVNIDDFPELAQKYNIRGIPTVLLFKDGEKMNTIVGTDAKKISTALQQIVG